MHLARALARAGVRGGLARGNVTRAIAAAARRGAARAAGDEPSSSTAAARLSGERLARFRAFRRRWETVITHLAPLGGLSEDNTVKLYHSGTELFRDMWSAIASARRTVLFGTYTLEPDAIGRNTLSALADATRRGCKVILLYDDVGSYRLGEADLEPLRQAGVIVLAFNPVAAWLWPWRWRHTRRADSVITRNHRKLLLCDDEAAFVGGMNVAADYVCSELGGTDFFADAHVRVSGSAVASLRAVFAESVREALLHLPADASRALAVAGFHFEREHRPDGELLGEALALAADEPAHGSAEDGALVRSFLGSAMADSFRRRLARIARRVPALRNVYNRLALHSVFLADDARHISHGLDVAPARGATPLLVPHAASAATETSSVLVQVLSSNARRGKYDIQRAMALSLLRAESTVFITTPYFMPPRWLTQNILRAARAGVDVRVLTAGMTDVPLYRMAAQHAYEVFLRNGVRIYELRSKALHAKTAVFDGMHATVGSFNLDLLSTHRNLEVSVSFLDASLAGQVQQRFLADIAQAEPITLEAHAQRGVLARAAQYIVYRALNLLLV